MPLHMVDGNCRHFPRIGEATAKRRPHEQRTNQSGSGGKRNGVDCFPGTICTVQNLAHERHQPANVVTRRELRHDAAVSLMKIDLRVQCVGEQALFGAIHRNASLIAGCLDSKDTHNANRHVGKASTRSYPFAHHCGAFWRSGRCPTGG